MTDEPEDTTVYDVVVNQEEQYSIWDSGREPPLGWETVGVRGSREHCLDWIEAHWTDMRPKSLRDYMASQGQ